MKANNPPEKVRIVLTGGHAGATAYALIEEIKAQRPSWEISWIGPKSAVEGRKTLTYEQQVFPQIGIKIYPITSGRIQRRLSVWTLPSLFKIPLGFFQALLILLSLKPQIILSFGGYASFPVVVVGWLLGIPIILHEQTFSYGRASRYSIPFAKKIALARQESLPYFPRQKSVIIGNPVSQAVRNITPKTKLGQPPLIFIAGGSRGSETINDTLAEILPQLLADYKIVHQTGELQADKFLDFKSALTDKLQKHYTVVGFIQPTQWAKYLNQADLVIARAGANTVSEIIVAKKPAIFIPLPFSFQDEQTENAESVVQLGFAEIIRQKDLTPVQLLTKIRTVVRNYQHYLNQALKSQSLDIQASKNLLNLIDEEIKNR